MVDPVSVASLGLAVIPLIISAFENQEVTFQPFVTFHRSRKEAQRFRNILKIQQTVFENECRLLLSSITRKQDEMLSNPDHTLWRDHDLAKLLGAYLDDSLETCVSTLELIHRTLKEINDETHGGFQDLEKLKESGKSRSSIFQQRLKLSFSKPRLEEKIDELRKHNGDLRVLSKHMKRLVKEQGTRPLPTAQYGTIRQVSHKLYDALSSAWSCATHVEHSVNICLGDIDGTESQIFPSNIRFNMVFTFAEAEESRNTGKPLRLTIESVLEQTESKAKIVSAPDRVGFSTLSTVLHEKGKSVSFALPPARNLSVMCHQNNGSGPSLENRPVDLCSVDDMCLYIQRCLQTSAAPLPCIGFLQHKSFKHFVYPPQSTQHCMERVMSLNDALKSAETSPYGIPIVDKLRLAKLLAQAVLQFHSTPWLREEWHSCDVYFFVSHDPSQSSLQVPYLSARFSKSSGTPRDGMTDCQSTSRSSLSLARNSILFSLGVVLLELCFEAPICDLQQPEDRRGGHANEYTQYWTARRLSEAVSSKLSHRYGKLVNRCINCDFGLGGSYELESNELQSAFFHGVICELDKCLKAAMIC